MPGHYLLRNLLNDLRGQTRFYFICVIFFVFYIVDAAINVIYIRFFFHV